VKKTFGVALGLVVILAAALAGISQRLFFARADSATGSGSPAGCQFLSSPSSTAAFCDTFNAPAGTGNRSGDLNGTVWGVSRLTQNQNPGAQTYNGWESTALNLCGTTITAQPEMDVRICGGHVAEAVNDGSNAAALAMYAKQPFDIANRTGVITLDVSNDTQGPHGAWPEVWFTDQPVPAPFADLPGIDSEARNAFGVRLFNTCTASDGTTGWTLGAVIEVQNYVPHDSFSGAAMPFSFNRLACVTDGSASHGTLNHVEVHLSTSQADIYASDAYPIGGTIPPMQHIGTISGLALTLTRGVIWTVDGHYNGDKFGNQGTHTFYWDNVGFDGPTLPQDRTFDVLDNTFPNLGWGLGTNDSRAVTTLPVDSTSLANATGALLTFNPYSGDPISTFHVAINGHAHDFASPYPYTRTYLVQTVAIPIPLSDVVAGPNTIVFSTDSGFHLTFMNVDIVLLGGGGSSGIAPTTAPTTASTTAPTATATPATAAPAPQATPLAINAVPCSVMVNGVRQYGLCTGQFTPHS
jgi:hypothetical protein